MEIQYVYTKKRRDFGQQCFFSDCGPHILIDIPHDDKLAEEYIQLPNLEKGIQCSAEMSEHEVNTIHNPTESRGMNHREGGWPIDVNPADEEQVARFRKKVEKDENYCNVVVALGNMMNHFVMQNNAVDIYEEYFPEEEIEEEEEVPSARTISVFRDFSPMSRSVSHITWCPEGYNRLAVSYSCVEYQGTSENASVNSFVWDLDNPNEPCLELKPDAAVVCIEYCPKDVNTIIGGCANGQIVLWDTRKGSIPVDTTSIEHSHKDPVYDVCWLPSKSATECFSASSDGQILWWDIRKLYEPTDVLILDPTKTESPNLTEAFGATCLEYEPSMPNKFMIGTEQGVILSCNRKTKTPTEKIAAVYCGHKSPVYAVQRNPFFPKNFLTIGAWAARLWSEDIKESSLLSIWNGDSYITDGSWSPVRPSVLLLTKTSGDLEIWDILFKQHAPTLSMKVEDEGLCCVKVHERGSLVACGAESGTTYLLELSPSLITVHKNDKSYLCALFDREGKREKILEAYNKELERKASEKGEEEPTSEGEEQEIEEELKEEVKADVAEQVEQDYVETVETLVAHGIEIDEQSRKSYDGSEVERIVIEVLDDIIDEVELADKLHRNSRFIGAVNKIIVNKSSHELVSDEAKPSEESNNNRELISEGTKSSEKLNNNHKSVPEGTKSSEKLNNNHKSVPEGTKSSEKLNNNHKSVPEGTKSSEKLDNNHKSVPEETQPSENQ